MIGIGMPRSQRSAARPIVGSTCQGRKKSRTSSTTPLGKFGSDRPAPNGVGLEAVRFRGPGGTSPAMAAFAGWDQDGDQAWPTQVSDQLTMRRMTAESGTRITKPAAIRTAYGDRVVMVRYHTKRPNPVGRSGSLRDETRSRKFSPAIQTCHRPSFSIRDGH